MKFACEYVRCIIFFVFIRVCVNLTAEKNLCPLACNCDSPKQQDVIAKMKCSDNLWNESDLKNTSIFFVPNFLQHLDLSKNRITTLSSYFLSVPLLKKLNLSENRIRNIDELAFGNVTSLQVLDISSNLLISINKNIFFPLSQLEKLKLRNNKLYTLQSYSFSFLPKLKVLDLSENLWRCDCDLLWFSEWARTTPIKLQTMPKCDGPEPYIGVSLKRLDLHCEQPESLQLEPSHNQVVFAGDSLDLRCRSVGGAKRVRWEWPSAPSGADEVVEEERTLPEDGLVESSLQIKRLSSVHSGNWICQQVAPGNNSATISVLVISPDTVYCPDAVSKDNKGVYYWPRTVAENAVELPCAGERVGTGSLAVRYCSVEGQWQHSNTSLCPYMSEMTKILEQFSKDNLSLPGDSIIIKAKRLWNLTYTPESLTDPMDVVFVSRTIQTYAKHIGGNRELAVILIDIVASMQRLPKSMLRASELRDNACSRMLATLQLVAQQLPALQVHSSMLSLEEYTVPADSFLGMACAWVRGSRQFVCGTNLHAVLAGREVEAAVEMPSSLFSGLESTSRQLLISMFANGHLFTDSSNQIASTVVGINIVGATLVNLTDAVVVMVRVMPGIKTTPVWWDGDNWRDDGCRLSHVNRDLQVFNCNLIGYYTVLQNLGLSKRGFQWVASEGAVYSGSFVLLVCLALCVLSYVVCRSAVQMPRRAKHTLVNIWLAIFFLCLLFTFGVSETEEVHSCQMIGLALHYLSLCSLLWLTVAANHMYKRLSRVTDRPQQELPPGTPAQKPILGMYLVGWGIGLIVCGISGAVHLREYAQPAFCFLGAGPALSAVLVPTVVLILLLLALHALSLCVIRSNDVNGQLSEGTQGTEHVDLELLEDGACAEHRSARSMPSDSDDTEDPEHAPLVQLKAQVIVLTFLVLTWLSGAVAITAGPQPIVTWQEPLAAGLYCFFAMCLGAFILYFYCVARSDVRAGWGAWHRMMSRRRRCCRTRSISDTHASLPLQTAPPQQVLSNGPPSVQSSSSHRTRAVSDLNNCERKPSSSVNLVAMHRQLYRSNNSMPTYHEISGQDCIDAFYNPRQSIVAKKFFKKQRRNKRNELGLRRRGDGGTSEGEVLPQVCRTWRPSAESAVFLSSDMESEKLTPSLFGYKINNTNIHVGEGARRRDAQSPKDPNVLSEEESEKSNGKVLLARLVIGAEGETPSLGRVDEEPIAPDCRSVELQCSLGDTDDSFTAKLDGLQLHSDMSCTDSPVSPPHYVTVVDPKYGVVKMTMSDYQEQAHRVCLASPNRCRSLPPTPEEVIGDEAGALIEPSIDAEGAEDQATEARIADLPLTIYALPSEDRKRATRPSYLGALPRNYYSRRKEVTQRRSLPSSPEGTGCGQRLSPRRSLPPSPIMTLSQSPVSSISDLPPPPSSVELSDGRDFLSSDLTLATPQDPPLAEQCSPCSSTLPEDPAPPEQWKRPSPPTSPERCDEIKRRRPILNRSSPPQRLSLTPSPDEAKKETSV